MLCPFTCPGHFLPLLASMAVLGPSLRPVSACPACVSSPFPCLTALLDTFLPHQPPLPSLLPDTDCFYPSDYPYCLNSSSFPPLTASACCASLLPIRLSLYHLVWQVLACVDAVLSVSPANACFCCLILLPFSLNARFFLPSPSVPSPQS